MKTKNSHIALAALSVELVGTVPSEIQLLPDGLFKANDGRPKELDGWVLNHESAQAVIQLAQAKSNAFCIDYEHQLLYAKQNGMPAPAAGWFKSLQYREGLGLFATQVEWTDSAALAIQNKEYRYISPVFSFNAKTGAIEQIHMAALTNNPALDNMKDLTALAADFFSPQHTDSNMEKIEELQNQVSDLQKQLADKETQIAALSAQTPKADGVPIEAVLELQKEIAALNSRINQNAVEDLVKVGLSDGRITPALADWAKSQPIEALSAYLEKATPIAALSGTQTGGTSPAGEPEPELTPDEIAVCSAMNLTTEQFIASKGAN